MLMLDRPCFLSRYLFHHDRSHDTHAQGTVIQDPATSKLFIDPTLLSTIFLR